MVIQGKAECQWYEIQRIRQRGTPTHFFGKETYLDSVTYLFGSAHGDPLEIPAGAHAYNFEFLLPESLPYSIEGRKGFIRYLVEATLEIPLAFDLESKKPIKVVRHDDLNLITSPNYRLPCEVEEFKTFGFLWWKSKPLFMAMRIPKTGFGLAETIPIHVQMVNNSSRNVSATELRLVKLDTFNSTSSQKSTTSSFVVVYKSTKGVGAGQTVNFDEFLEIPLYLPTSNDRFCKIFQIHYNVSLSAKVGCFVQSSPEMNIAITIGNVGIADVSVSAEFKTQTTFSTPIDSAPPLMGDLRE